MNLLFHSKHFRRVINLSDIPLRLGSLCLRIDRHYFWKLLLYREWLEIMNIFCYRQFIWSSHFILCFLTFFRSLIMSFRMRVYFTDVRVELIVLRIITFVHVTYAATLNWKLVNFTKLNSFNLVINLLTLNLSIFIAGQSYLLCNIP